MGKMLRVGSLCALFLTAGCASGPTNSDGQAKIDMCQAIATQYQAALVKAEECTVGAPNQCLQSGIASFFCQCHVVVNGGTAGLAAISARFDAAGCMRGCVGSCVNETAATCAADPISSTGGRCLFVQTDGGP